MDTILIAAEENDDREYVLGLLEDRQGWKVRTASTGREALNVLAVERIDLLLTDAELQDMPSPDFLAELRRRFPLLPVVLMTTKGPNEALVRALRLGAASYVPRSSLARDLFSTVSRVLALCERHQLGPELLACRTSARTTFVLSNDTAVFQPVITYIQDELERFHECEPRERVNTGIAVEEALLNAMVHGNLEIGPDVREEGLQAYEERIAERRQQTPYRDRKITLTCAFRAKSATVRVRDEGAGFDVSSLPDATAPENVGKSGGRGLLLIRSFMDDVHFNRKGNEILMVKRRAGRGAADASR